jgi:hypothetical protein
LNINENHVKTAETKYPSEKFGPVWAAMDEQLEFPSHTVLFTVSRKLLDVLFDWKETDYFKPGRYAIYVEESELIPPKPLDTAS